MYIHLFFCIFILFCSSEFSVTTDYYWYFFWSGWTEALRVGRSNLRLLPRDEVQRTQCAVVLLAGRLSGLPLRALLDAASRLPRQGAPQAGDQGEQRGPFPTGRHALVNGSGRCWPRLPSTSKNSNRLHDPDPLVFTTLVNARFNTLPHRRKTSHRHALKHWNFFNVCQSLWHVIRIFFGALCLCGYNFFFFLVCSPLFSFSFYLPFSGSSLSPL